jgi:hypothetical protein
VRSSFELKLVVCLIASGVACTSAGAQAPPATSAPHIKSAPATQSTPAAQATPATAPAAQSNATDAIRILYTGKGMGYFRIPDWQGPAADGGGCTDPARQKPKSDAAAEFEDLMKTQFHIGTTKGAILLGTGDNFAPEIEARDFCNPPPGQPDPTSKYQRVGKELFDWDAPSKSWIRSDGHTAANPAPANGIFMLPIDNVANFFVQEGYAALVPGKQDFYFGPERIREVARFMASKPIADSAGTLHIPGQGTQMLGANMVVETTWKTAHQTLPDSENPPWFIPRFPTAADLNPDADGSDLEIRMTGVSDNGKVYPWLRGVTVTLAGQDANTKLLPLMNAASFYLCQVDGNSPGIPNAIPQPVKDGPCAKLQPKPGAKPTDITLDFPWLASNHFFTLNPGANYGLCVVAAHARVKALDGSFTFCDRFNVYMPFFQSSNGAGATTCTDFTRPECYHDPDPYVLIQTQDENGVPEDVAIFGVIDPQIGANVGLLNMAWSNTESKQYKTETAVEEPASALKQLLDSFDRQYDESGFATQVAAGNRRLIKVLLAQMNSQEAEILGTRLKQFQIIVSAADQELATVGDTINSTWNAPQEGSVRHPMSIAIPEPYFIGSRNPSAVVDIGRLDITISAAADQNSKWSLLSEHMELGKPKNKEVATTAGAGFWRAVSATLKRDCAGQNVAKMDQTTQIEVLTLCEMQRETGADLAILQVRDFFAQLPPDAGDIPDLSSKTPEDILQQILDRIVWKGDFLKLLYVPGSALQQALTQSKAFDAADRNNLSVSQNKNRGLVTVGLTFDAAHGEYLIDGNRLNPTKLYAVATSDFIGGGDTGYPALAAAQIRPPLVPSDFEKELLTVSAAVCRGLAGDNWQPHCIGPINRDYYLDEIKATPPNTGPSSTPKEQLWAWTIFHHPHPVPGEIVSARVAPVTLQSQMDQFIEYRPIWDFALVKATFGITELGHNGSDAQIDSNFGGITTPGVNSHRFTNWASDFQAQVTRNWKHYQFFASPSYTFNVQYKGQSNASRQVNQIANLGMFDTGFARLWRERGPDHMDIVVTEHFETPLEETVTAFTLKSTPAAVLQFSQPRNYTSLSRAGFRWQRRVSSVEFGPEAGHVWDALQGFNFLNTSGVVTATCLAKSTVSFATCVSNDSNPKVTNPPTILPTSTVQVSQVGQGQAGIYWKIGLTVPLYTKVSYVFTDSGDWFFVNFASQNSTNTLFRDIEQHQLRFTIFPSLSIGPEFDLLLYENKTVGTLRGQFLRQDQIIMRANFGFDWFNLRKTKNQIEYAPAAK